MLQAFLATPPNIYRSKPLNSEGFPFQVYEMDESNLGFCGIDCNACHAYLATQADDAARLAEVAKGWSSEELPLGPNDVLCDGCHSDRVAKFAPDCTTRQCGLEKRVSNCAQCGEYVCEKLEKHWGMLGEETRNSSKSTLDKLSLSYEV